MVMQNAKEELTFCFIFSYIMNSILCIFQKASPIYVFIKCGQHFCYNVIYVCTNSVNILVNIFEAPQYTINAKASVYFYIIFSILQI